MKKYLLFCCIVFSLIIKGHGQDSSKINEQKTIVFICEHGAYKSVVAAAYFNKMAKEQGLNVRAVARGTIPRKDIAPDALHGLQKDSLFFENLAPQKLSNEELAKATRVISFCSLPNGYKPPVSFENWEKISLNDDNYTNFRDSVVPKIKLLINNYKKPN